MGRKIENVLRLQESMLLNRHLSRSFWYGIDTIRYTFGSQILGENDPSDDNIRFFSSP